MSTRQFLPCGRKRKNRENLKKSGRHTPAFFYAFLALQSNLRLLLKSKGSPFIFHITRVCETGFFKSTLPVLEKDWKRVVEVRELSHGLPGFLSGSGIVKLNQSCGSNHKIGETPLFFPGAVGLRVHKAILCTHDRVKITLLQQKQSAGDCHLAEICQRLQQVNLGFYMRQRIAQA